MNSVNSAAKHVTVAALAFGTLVCNASAGFPQTEKGTCSEVCTDAYRDGFKQGHISGEIKIMAFCFLTLGLPVLICSTALCVRTIRGNESTGRKMA